MTTVREQLPLSLRYDAGNRPDFRDAAARDNKALPIHRWVPWIAGFSAQFVEDVIDAYLPQKSRGRELVLDPFAGVGTTLVEALKAGCNTLGYEINPFAVLAARAKVNCVDVQPQEFEAEVANFRAQMESFEGKVDKLWSAAGDEGLIDLLKPLRANVPQGFRSRIRFFSPPVEAKFLKALKLVMAPSEPHRSMLRLALGATMVSFSNYTYEPSLSSRPGAGKALIENASVERPAVMKMLEFKEDVAWARELYGACWSERVREVVHASYFASRGRQPKASLIVTSPPYMNNYHYVRNTRPQLYWLGLVDGARGLKGYEDDNFGKFWQTVRQGEAISVDFEFPELAAQVDCLRALSPERGAYGGPGWANYVATYFNDCARFVDLVRRQLKRGGRAVVVVGNSIIQGIEFQVDRLLAEMAERRGLVAEEVKIVRTKRVGNSIIESSVRNGGASGEAARTQLYDAAVILRV